MLSGEEEEEGEGSLGLEVEQSGDRNPIVIWKGKGFMGLRQIPLWFQTGLISVFCQSLLPGELTSLVAGRAVFYTLLPVCCVSCCRWDLRGTGVAGGSSWGWDGGGHNLDHSLCVVWTGHCPYLGFSVFIGSKGTWDGTTSIASICLSLIYLFSVLLERNLHGNPPFHSHMHSYTCVCTHSHTHTHTLHAYTCMYTRHSHTCLPLTHLKSLIQSSQHSSSRHLHFLPWQNIPDIFLGST